MIYDKDLAPYGTTREYECAKEIYNYFLEQHLEFDINNFELRSSAGVPKVNNEGIVKK